MEEPRFHRASDGQIRLRIPPEERDLIREIARSTLALIAAGDEDPALRRLHPPAYVDDELEREYRELTRRQLTTGREHAFDVLGATLDRDVMSPDEADAWLRALNAVRLVLGTRLDVTEDFDWDAVDPHGAEGQDLAVYAYVSWLQEQLVDATF